MKRQHYDPKETFHCSKACDDSPYEFCETCYVPAYTPARSVASNKQRIPRVIFQTWKTRKLGVSGLTRIRSLIDMNPEYEYILFTDEDMDKFACENFPKNI